MKRKALSWLLCLVMVVGLLPTAALAANEDMSGNCGATDSDSVTWKLEQNNEDSDNPTYTLTISGSGAMADFKTEDVKNQIEDTRPWKDSLDRIVKIVVENNVTYIGENAFNGCANCTHISVGTGVIKIAKRAFSVIGSAETPYTINFNNTTSLKEIDHSFRDSTGLKEITIPASVTTIGVRTFRECNNLTTVSFEKDSQLKTIGDQAFYLTPALTSLDFTNTKLQTIGEGAFSGATSLKTVFMPDTVTSIGKQAFNKCTSLTAIRIPSNITEIEQETFYMCISLTNVVVPANVILLEKGAFQRNSQMHSVDLTSASSNIIITKGGNDYVFRGLASNNIIYISGADFAEKLEKTSHAIAVTKGGTFPSNPAFEDGKLAIPTKEGYTFGDWYSAADFIESSKVTESTAISAGKTYYAKWTLDAPTVTVSANKTSVVSSTGTATLTATAQHEAEGVTYEYQWYTGTPDNGTEISGATSQTYTVYNLTSDTTYYCKVKAVNGSDKSEAATSDTVTISVANAEGSVVITNNKTTATYGDAPFTFTYTASGTATVESSDDSVATVSDSNGTVTVTIIGAGSATISVSSEASSDYTAASAEFTLTVAKATLIITADNKSIYVGGTLPEYTYTVSGFVGEDTESVITTKPTMTCSDANANTAGSYTITPSGANAGENYTITYVNGTLTVSRRPSGSSSSSGSTTNTVAVDNTKNGSVSVSPKNASKGTTVTITAKPDTGYELDTLVVTDKNGDTVKLTRKSDTQYTFTMPASKVTVEANFTEIEEQPAVSFIDVPSSAYYYDAVAWAVENGVTNGTSATTFSPDASCTRAQMVTFLWRAAGSPKATGGNPFTDVSANAYYYEAVLWAVEQGITNGTSATTFSPDATVTRGQTATFLWRAGGSPAASGSSFADVAADTYYAPAVQWAVANGITNGTSSTTFSPDNACTRGQIVTFMYRDAQ